MKIWHRLFFLLLWLFIGSAVVWADSDRSRSVKLPEYNRIISLSPAITETLFALGVGDRVVGVTRYCTFPAEALEITKVGGYLDPGFEMMVGLDSDLVILLPYQSQIQQRLENLGLNCLVVNQENLQNILQSILDIGKLCGAEDRAKLLVGGMKNRIDHLRQLTKDLSHPEVMLSLGRDYGSSSIDQVFIAGQGSYLGDLLEIVGGVNAWKDASLPYPAMGLEGLLVLDPSVILEVLPSLGQPGYGRETIIAGWNSLADMQAVRNKRVFVIGGDFIAIPGPRLLLTLDAMAGVLYPGLDLSYDE